MSETPKGPTAVALLYEGRNAPRVVAKGKGEIGQAIIDAARSHGVPLQQDPVLAEALSSVELESEIPCELYQAVAVVIGFILRASGKAGPVRKQPPLRP
jgi:flagellar biosynthesis protein